jgi:hypothetical protein
MSNMVIRIRLILICIGLIGFLAHKSSYLHLDIMKKLFTLLAELWENNVLVATILKFSRWRPPNKVGDGHNFWNWLHMSSLSSYQICYRCLICHDSCHTWRNTSDYCKWIR